jgi:integrase
MGRRRCTEQQSRDALDAGTRLYERGASNDAHNARARYWCASEPFSYRAARERALWFWKAAGLDPIGLHECRHAGAAAWIAAGVNAKAITTFMEHANVATIFDLYGHRMPGGEDEAVALLDAYHQRELSRTPAQQAETT